MWRAGRARGRRHRRGGSHPHHRAAEALHRGLFGVGEAPRDTDARVGSWRRRHGSDRRSSARGRRHRRRRSHGDRRRWYRCGSHRFRRRRLGRGSRRGKGNSCGRRRCDGRRRWCRDGGCFRGRRRCRRRCWYRDGNLEGRVFPRRFDPFGKPLCVFLPRRLHPLGEPLGVFRRKTALVRASVFAQLPTCWGYEYHANRHSAKTGPGARGSTPRWRFERQVPYSAISRSSKWSATCPTVTSRSSNSS